MSNRPQLPIVDSRKTDILTVEGGTFELAVTDTPVLIEVPDGKDYTRLGIQVPDDAQNPIYVGGANTVSPTGSTRGRKLGPGQDRDEDTVREIWLVADTGVTVNVVVEWAR